MATDVGLADLPAVPFAAVRFDVAAALLFAAVFATGADVRPRTRDTTSTCSSGALIIGAHRAFLFSPVSGTSQAVSPLFCWGSSP